MSEMRYDKPEVAKLRGMLVTLQDENASLRERLARAEEVAKMVGEAYQAHRVMFNHMADCRECREPMTNLCPAWERLMSDGCGRADYAYDAALARYQAGAGKPYDDKGDC